MWPDPFFYKSSQVTYVEDIKQQEDLIILVRERPALCDPRHRGHRDPDLITALWREVATEQNSPDKNILLLMLKYHIKIHSLSLLAKITAKKSIIIKKHLCKY